jgi:hypothetical protein
MLQKHGDLRGLHVYFTKNRINRNGRGLKVMNIVHIYIMESGKDSENK